jgi:VWFA-related protein
LLDISGSMRKHIEQMSEVAREALRFLLPGDRVAVMTFGVRSNVHLEWKEDQAEVARALRTGAEDQDRVGYGTAINAAVIDACRYISKDESSGRYAILIVTDNLGLNYQANDTLTIGYLLKANAVLNAIVVGRAIRPGALSRRYENPDFTPADVFRLADATGGEAVKAERAAASFPEMVARIREQYTLAYHVPEDAKPGEFRHIAVTLVDAVRRLHPKAEVRTREGYYVRP